jgi:hypothetical protein
LLKRFPDGCRMTGLTEYVVVGILIAAAIVLALWGRSGK